MFASSSHATCPILLSSFAAVTALAALPAQVPQPEVCIPQPPPSVIGVLAPGQHVCGAGGTGLATLAPVGRIDVYVFDHTAGETLWLRGYTGGSLDLQLRVLDPAAGFVVVASASCSGNSGSYPYGAIVNSTQIVFDPTLGLQTGSYLLEVSDAGSNETGAYTLSLERISLPAGPMLSNAVTVTDTISPVTDEDLLGFAVVQGSLVNVFLRTMGCLDLEYRVLDSSGALVHGPAVVQGNAGSYPYGCIVNQVSFNPFATPGNPNEPAPLTGDYWLVLGDSGATETGTYDAKVQCVYSPSGCPNTGTNFLLAMPQPTGAGSLAIDVLNGTPGAPYITAFSFDPVNAPAPHTGWFGGLHIGFLELNGVMGLGWPFVGLLDATGQSRFSTPFPPGPFPPIYAATVELSPGFQSIVRATPVITVNLL